MRDACIRAVNNAMQASHGRDATQAELRNIEVRIRNARVQAAKKDPASFNALSPAQQMAEAGKLAAQQIAFEKQMREMRARESILAHDRLTNYVATQTTGTATQPAADANGLDALERIPAHKYDEKNGEIKSIEETSNATAEDAMRQIASVFEAINPNLWARVQQGIIKLEPVRKAFTDALHGVTKDIPPEFIAAAKVYHQIAEDLRQRFNAAGGVIGKLEDFGIPHSWSGRLLLRYDDYGRDLAEVVRLRATLQLKQAEALAQLMKDRARDNYVKNMMGWANRDRYVQPDGRLFDDAELRLFFTEAWKTVVSDGMTKDKAPGFPGGAVKANRGSQHRVIHLKPEANYYALAMYSDENVLEAMVNGIRRMSRDVALVKTLGPNPDQTWALVLAKAVQEASRLDPTRGAYYRQRADSLQRFYDQVAGNSPLPSSRAVSDVFATARNIHIASKLGSAVISSISDLPTMYITAMNNKLNPFKVLMNSTLAWSPDSRRYARRMGLMLDTVIGDMERYAGENLTSKALSSQVASTVVRASGLTFVTNARRVGFSMTMMDTIGQLTRRFANVTDLGAHDYAILAAKGITPETWSIWRSAKVDAHKFNNTLLTPDNIMAVTGASIEARQQAVIDLLAIVRSEQDLAIINPGARERWQMLELVGRPEAGTVGGEIFRSALLFKSFPWTVLQRHWARAGFHDSKVGYLASMFVSMWMMGILAGWMNDLRRGREMRSINVFDHDKRRARIARDNVIAGMLRGGALGVYADFLFAETNQTYGNSLAEIAAGPNVSTLTQLQALTLGNAYEASRGEDTNIGAEAVRFAKSMTPGQNLWWTQLITDRLIFDQIAEAATPGYNQKVQRRARSNENASYWWAPGETAPESAPDIGAPFR